MDDPYSILEVDEKRLGEEGARLLKELKAKRQEIIKQIKVKMSELKQKEKEQKDKNGNGLLAGSNAEEE